MFMKPQINNNGMTREAHVEARVEIKRAIEQVMERLQEIKPHGRDYQTLSNTEFHERMKADEKIYQERFALLDKLRNELLDEAVAIQNENKE